MSDKWDYPILYTIVCVIDISISAEPSNEIVSCIEKYNFNQKTINFPNTNNN